MPRIVLAGPPARWLPAGRQGERAFVVEGATVRECMEWFFKDVPSMRSYLLEDHGALRHHVAAFVNGSVVQDKQTLHQAVNPDDEIFLMQALSGG